DRLAIGMWDLGSFRRPLKTAHYLSVATTSPTTRVAIATRSDAPSALALKWIRQQLSEKTVVSTRSGETVENPRQLSGLATFLHPTPRNHADQIVRVQVSCDEWQTPVIREESTRRYQDR